MEAQEELAPTILAAAGESGNNKPCVAYGISSYDSNAMKSSNPHSGIYEANTSRTLDLNGGNPACNQGGIAIVEAVGMNAVGADLYNQAITGDKAATLSANSCMTATRNGPSVIEQRNLQQTFVAVPNLLLDDQGGQQISVRTDDKCPTLRAEAHGNVPCVVESAGFKAGQGPNARSIGWEKEKSPTLAANAGGNTVPAVAYSIENHPADSRVSIDDSGKVQTLTSRMGTGGGNVPMVMERQTAPNVVDVEMEVAVRKYEVDRDRLIDLLRSHKGDFTNAQIAEALHRPLTLVEHWFRRDSCFAVPDPDIWFRLKRLLGIETTEFDACITEYEFKGGNYDMRNRIYTGDVAPTLTGGCGNHLHLVSEPTAAYGVDCRNGNENCELYPTLQAKPNGGHSLNFSGVVRENYIVRRLTPTECARLQGFPDDWGHIEKKDSLTSEELAFWQEVRNAYASINGKLVKEYTEKQMLTWYNKLHTDSAEYKMWGNGIALPTALYCMEGIAEVLNERKGSLGLHPAESL